MFRHGLKVKILAVAIGISLSGLGFFIYRVIGEEERGLLRERLRASELMAEPILHTIYKDMLEERADMPRFLMEGLKTIKGVDRVQIVRSNGVEEAFQDFKTLEAVKKEFGEVKPEWLVDHPEKLHNVASGIEAREFEKALSLFQAGGRKPVYYIEESRGKNLFTYLVPIVARPKCAGCHGEEETARGILMISTSLDEVYAALAGVRNRWIVQGVGAIALMSLLLWLLISSIVTRPVDRAASMLRAIAEGKGDLAKRLDITSRDEVGALADSFNRFVDGLRHIVMDIFSVSDSVNSASREIEASSRRIVEGAEAQLEAASDTSSSITEMDLSIKAVAEEAKSLSVSYDEVSESSVKMREAADAVKENLDKLSYLSSSINSSINGIARSINQAASHIDALFAKTEEVVSSILDVNTRVREVETYSIRQAEVAEKARVDAEEVGLNSVIRTREGIERVSAEIRDTAGVIDRLGERSKEIGKIIDVINDVTDTTHLLALNATILASQAGEHGKGFAVVARQIKDLAAKTTASTKEITSLIAQVQGSVSSSIESMKMSSEMVEGVVRLSRSSEQALVKILEGAGRSFQMAKMIEKATIEQTKGTGRISETARAMKDMVEEIKTAAQEERETAQEILKDTLNMEDFMERVKTSAEELSRESRRVGEEILEVAEKIKAVFHTTSDQMNLSKNIVSAMETVRAAAEGNARFAKTFEETVKEMKRQSEALRSTVRNFKT